MADQEHPRERIIPLSSGTIRIRTSREDWPLDRACAFAARDNPRRGFLVVSKLLGRHIPARPSEMRASMVDLANALPADLPGPILFLGLAETAICLGQGVHESYRAITGRDDCLFLHSTRQQLDHPLLARFDEPHSHASRHLIYRPVEGLALLTAARTLVMVDDEVSTGTTLRNLADAVVTELPGIERVVVATLADWSDGAAAAAMPRPAEIASLIAGRLEWTPGAPPPVEPPAFDVAARAMGGLAAHHNYGRLGRLDTADEGDALADTIALPPASRIRIVCTAEFTYPPFRIAERLEAAGHDVVVQSTTRSPARIDGAIAHALRFADNYGTPVANYLYNVAPDDPRISVIVHETPPGSIDPALVAALDARLLWMGPR